MGVLEGLPGVLKVERPANDRFEVEHDPASVTGEDLVGALVEQGWAARSG